MSCAYKLNMVPARGKGNSRQRVIDRNNLHGFSIHSGFPAGVKNLAHHKDAVFLSRHIQLKVIGRPRRPFHLPACPEADGLRPPRRTCQRTFTDDVAGRIKRWIFDSLHRSLAVRNDFDP